MTNLEREKHSGTAKRMSLLFLIIFLALAVLIFRLAFFQLSKGDELLRTSENNRYITQPIPAPRGIIYDRTGTVELVRNKPSYTITFQRLSNDIQDPIMLVAKMWEQYDIFKMEPVEIWNAMDPFGDKYLLGAARKVIKNADPRQVAYLREHQEEFPGMNVVVEPIREYPNTTFASHVLGYLNDIPQDYWKEHKDQYQQTDLIGTSGLEKQYEEYLHGKDGKLKVEVNRYYQPLNDVRTEEPIKGHDLVLTIDKQLQDKTEAALAKQVQELNKRIKSVKNGAAIAMNPRTGEVLAMASYPTFDPNKWVEGWSQKDYEEVFAPAEKNRATQELYQPGSTIKMATVLAGLKENVITKNTQFNDPGFLRYGRDQPIRSWKSMGTINAYQALAESSNVFMMKIVEGMSNYRPTMNAAQTEQFLATTLPQTMERLIGYHKEFGMGPGVTTGLDLPYEAEGKITRQGLFADLLYASFGQTEYYTLMHLAEYVSTIANEGQRMKPHLVKQIRKPDASVLKTIEPEVEHQVSFSPEHLDIVQQGMLDVTQKYYGTFHSVFGTYPIKVAGKTGTSETGRGTENSVFVGYAPYDNPTIAVAIIIPDNTANSHSYDSVGPIAKAMMDAHFFPDGLPTENNEQKN